MDYLGAGLLWYQRLSWIGHSVKKLFNSKSDSRYQVVYEQTWFSTVQLLVSRSYLIVLESGYLHADFAKMV